MAPTPWQLRCGTCGAKLRITRHRGKVLFGAVAIGLLLGGAGAVVRFRAGPAGLPFAMLLFLAGAAAAEVVFYFIARRVQFGLTVRKTGEKAVKATLP